MSETAARTRAHTSARNRSERSVVGLVRYFVRLGAWGFGGPIALVGYMQRDLVEQRRWYTEQEFQQGLAVGQTMPGPLAAQVAMWLGYLHAGARGAIAVAVPFVLPPFVLVTVVAVLYAQYQGLAWVHAVFLGVGPAVLAIIAIAAYKLARSTNKTDPVLWAIAAILCAVTAIAGAEIVWLFLLAGAFGAAYYGGGLPKACGGGTGASVSPFGVLAAVQGLAWTGSGASLASLGWFFFKAGAFTFGSGLARALPARRARRRAPLADRAAVRRRRRHGAHQPRPCRHHATFAGYLVYGIAGALVATTSVFLPALLLVVIPGPFIRRHEKHPRLQGFIKGATAAAAGAIAGAAIVIARDIVDSTWSLLIALVALGLLLQPRLKVPEPALVAGAALVGLIGFG